MKSKMCEVFEEVGWSHPARGAWIEMIVFRSFFVSILVAPRKGRVD